MKAQAKRNGKPIDIKTVPFPEGVHNIRAVCQAESDGYYIYVRNDLDPAEAEFALGHELAHIFLGHLDDGGSFSMAMEEEADLHAAHYYELYERGALS